PPPVRVRHGPRRQALPASRDRGQVPEGDAPVPGRRAARGRRTAYARGGADDSRLPRGRVAPGGAGAVAGSARTRPGGGAAPARRRPARAPGPGVRRRAPPPVPRRRQAAGRPRRRTRGARTLARSPPRRAGGGTGPRRALGGRGTGRVGMLELERLAGVADLRAEWERLAEASGNPFATPDWSEAWLRQAGDGVSSSLWACRRPDGSVAAVLPLVLVAGRYVRKLRFLGFGAANELGPVC